MTNLYSNPADPQQRNNKLLTNIVSNFDDLSKSSLMTKFKNPDTDNFKYDRFDYSENIKPYSLIEQIMIRINLNNPIEWIFLVVFPIVTTCKNINKIHKFKRF